MNAQLLLRPEPTDVLEIILDDFLSIDLAKASATLCLGSVMEEGNLPEVQFVQTTDELSVEFLEVCRKRLEDLRMERRSGDLRLRPYSAASKPDRHEVEFLETNTYPHIQEQLAPLRSIADLKLFQMDPDFLAGLRFYVISVNASNQEPLYGFRAYSPKKELGRSAKFGALLAKGQFDRVREPMFLFDQNLDALVYQTHILVFNQDQFQKIFRFFELVRKTAEHTLRIIKRVVPIANFHEFEQACQGHLQKLTKLRNISQQPYLKQVTIHDLKKVIKRYGLGIATQMVNGEEMLVFDPEDRWAILKLLDDDYLESMLTEHQYEVTGKRLHA